jgi:hypothetical protein
MFPQEVAAARILEPAANWRDGFLGDAAPVWVANPDEVSSHWFFSSVLLRVFYGNTISSVPLMSLGAMSH